MSYMGHVRTRESVTTVTQYFEVAVLVGLCENGTLREHFKFRSNEYAPVQLYIIFI